MAKIVIPEDLKDKELFKFLVANKQMLITQKKYNNKEGDIIRVPLMSVEADGKLIIKGSVNKEDASGNVDVISVINTTNWFDSYGDVHIPGLWKKSLSENKELYLLQEHSMTFKGIITDQVKGYTKNMSWKSLGYNSPGNTEALIFDSTVSPNRNPYMYDQYKSGYVKNHSVGMQYVKILLAINDEDYKDEFATWNRYIDDIANKEDAEDAGYFWPVLEAKVFEGSAVPVGANRITPTLQTTEKEEPLPGTPSTQPAFDISAAIRKTKFF